MSNYTKTTNFATKDSLSSGDPAKKIKGTEFNAEFDAISTAIATKADLASPALTGTPTAPTASTGTNTTQIATTAFVTSAMAAAGAGTVTSVAVTSSDATVTGSPITGSGTIDIALNTVPVSKGGTGQTSFTNGQLLIGNTTGNTLTKATLTAGSGVSITNGNGSITIAATGTSGVSTFSGGTTGLTPSSATSGAITLAGTLAVANGGTGATTAANARTNLGLGTISTQNSSSVSITGGSIAGITDLAIADGGTGASTASDARTNLGLGSVATLSSINLTSNVTDVLPILNGGTGASTASGARTSLGLGTMATETASNYMTLGTEQTVTAVKTFSSRIGVNGDANGVWGLRVTGNDSHPAVGVLTSATSSDASGILVDVRGSNSIAMVFQNDGTQVGSVSISGSNTAYNTSSDYRLKKNVAPMTGAIAKVKALKPVTYTWKKDNVAGQGFIAHELQEVFPDAVTGAKDAVDAQGNPKYQGVDVSFLVATLTAALQEALVRIEALEAKVQ